MGAAGTTTHSEADFEEILSTILGGVTLQQACDDAGVKCEDYREWLAKKGIGMPIPRDSAGS